jgi:hypothetical protein
VSTTEPCRSRSSRAGGDGGVAEDLAPGVWGPKLDGGVEPGTGASTTGGRCHEPALVVMIIAGKYVVVLVDSRLRTPPLMTTSPVQRAAVALVQTRPDRSPTARRVRRLVRPCRWRRLWLVGQGAFSEWPTICCDEPAWYAKQDVQ